MSRSLHHPPSAGCLVLIASWVLLAGFMAWGSWQPNADRVELILWQMEREGFAGLTPQEVREIQKLLQRHPALARTFTGRRYVDLLEPTEQKWVALPLTHLVVRPAPAPLRFSVDCRATAATYPLRVEFRGPPQLQRSVSFSRDGRQSFDLPPGFPESPLLAEVRVVPAPSSQTPPTFQIRVTGTAVSEEAAP